MEFVQRLGLNSICSHIHEKLGSVVAIPETSLLARFGAEQCSAQRCRANRFEDEAAAGRARTTAIPRAI